MNLTGIDTPRFGFAFRSSLMSFHFSASSIMYRNGNSLVSLLSPRRKRVDLFTISSYTESLIYPDVVQLRSSPSNLAPIPLFMTSYWRRPFSPSHAAISSQMQSDGLKPSLFFALKAIFLTLLFVPIMARSDCLCFGNIEVSWILTLCVSRSSSSSFSAWYSGSSVTIVQMLL